MATFKLCHIFQQLGSTQAALAGGHRDGPTNPTEIKALASLLRQRHIVNGV
jgi:hypothetical protein